MWFIEFLRNTFLKIYDRGIEWYTYIMIEILIYQKFRAYISTTVQDRLWRSMYFRKSILWWIILDVVQWCGSSGPWEILFWKSVTGIRIPRSFRSVKHFQKFPSSTMFSWTSFIFYFLRYPSRRKFILNFEEMSCVTGLVYTDKHTRLRQ